MPPLAPTVPQPAGSPRMEWAGSQALLLCSGVAAALPVIASTVNAVRSGWEPAADRAIIASRAWDVLSTHTPLVGQYSEAGGVTGEVVHSLGPMLYWLLAIPARFGSAASLPITMGAMNTLAILATVALARRRGGRPLMLATALGIALMCQSLPTESFHDMWNPSAGLFPLLLEIFVCWSIACGDYRLLPAMALLASWLIQDHLMYVAPTLGLMVIATAGLTVARIAHLRRARKARAAAGASPLYPPMPPAVAAALAEGAPPGGAPVVSTIQLATLSNGHVSVGTNGHHGSVPNGWQVAHAGRVRRWVVLPWALLAVVVALICWSAPIVDELSTNPGNITLVVATATRHVPTVGASEGWHAVVRAVGITPWWLYVPATRWNRQFDIAGTPSLLRTDSTLALLAALGLVGLVALIRRRGDVAAAALIGLMLCGALAAQVAATPTTPLLKATLGYTTWWGSQLGMWVWLVLAWSAGLGLAWMGRRGRVAAVRRLTGMWQRLVRAPAMRGAEPATVQAAATLQAIASVRPVATLQPTATAQAVATVSAIASAVATAVEVAAVEPATEAPPVVPPQPPARPRSPGSGRSRLALPSFVGGALCVSAIAAVASAVAATGKPDEHVQEYRPIAQMAARLEQIIPPDQTIDLTQGTDDWATMPIKPGLRYWLVRHGDRVLAVGSYERLGDWYELYNRPYTWVVEVTDGLRAPARNMRLAVRVHFVAGWGPEVYSAWVRDVAQSQPTAAVLLPALADELGRAPVVRRTRAPRRARRVQSRH